MTASYAMLNDVNIGEPGAYIGFAGHVRVIRQTMRQKLPQDAKPRRVLAPPRRDRSGGPARGETRHGHQPTARANACNRTTIGGGSLKQPRLISSTISSHSGELENLRKRRDDNGAPGGTGRRLPRARSTVTCARCTVAHALEKGAEWRATASDRHTLDYLQWAFAEFVELHGDQGIRRRRAIVGGPPHSVFGHGDWTSREGTRHAAKTWTETLGCTSPKGVPLNRALDGTGRCVGTGLTFTSVRQEPTPD